MLVIGGAAVNAIVLGFFADIFGMPHTLVGAALIAAACLPVSIASIMKWRKAALPGTQP
jgi:sugar (pentulose or hexulose) kinase